MTYTELKERWDYAMKSRDRAIHRGDANGIEGNLSLLNTDTAMMVVMIDQIVSKLADAEKEDSQ